MQLNGQDPARVTIKDFLDQYHPTITREAIAYARKVGKVDYEKVGARIYILLTEKTLSYSPNRYKDLRQ